MDPLALDLLMARFDNLETLIKDNGDKLDAHKKDDLDVAKVVGEHSTYWKLFTYITGGVFLTAIAWIGVHLR